MQRMRPWMQISHQSSPQESDSQRLIEKEDANKYNVKTDPLQSRKSVENIQWRCSSKLQTKSITSRIKLDNESNITCIYCIYILQGKRIPWSFLVLFERRQETMRIQSMRREGGSLKSIEMFPQNTSDSKVKNELLITNF